MWPVTVVQRDPDIRGGTPVFTGTHVPEQMLTDYLDAGQLLSDFIDDFPTVTRDQAIAALEVAKPALLADGAQVREGHVEGRG
jgi:uncharacterized protein (DUF433 family)